MKLHHERVRQNVQKSTTEDLLDRATVYRTEMETAALALIDAELAARGITAEMVEDHLRQRGRVLTRTDGTAIKCTFCWKPAVAKGWGWHRLFGRVPLFPRLFRWCSDHVPASCRHEKDDRTSDALE